MKILLFSRHGTIHTAEELRHTFEAIQRCDFDYAVNKEFAQDIATQGFCVIPSELIFEEYPDISDVVALICYGGDGTLLAGVRLLRGAPIPVVGINTGHMGFLTGGCRDDITLLFEQLATGQLRIEQRTMLCVEETSEKLFAKALAVNEVAIQRSGSGMIAVECSIDNQAVATFYGDGMIVATPTGSTAYSLSAGGPVVAPGCRCLILSPLASHNLTMRPIVVPDTSSIRLRVRARRSSVTLSIDNTAYEIADGTEITVTCSEKRIFLAQVHNISFYDTLRDKMMWGIDIRD
jgi:NAD+ kinase